MHYILQLRKEILIYYNCFMFTTLLVEGVLFIPSIPEDIKEEINYLNTERLYLEMK